MKRMRKRMKGRKSKRKRKRRRMGIKNEEKTRRREKVEG